MYIPTLLPRVNVQCVVGTAILGLELEHDYALVVGTEKEAYGRPAAANH